MDMNVFLILGLCLSLLVAIRSHFLSLSLILLYWFIPFLSALEILPDFSAVPIPWSGILNCNIQYNWDGLSDLFALLISGIGILIFHYAYHYIQAEKRSKLLALLQFFAVSMFGLVMADDLILLFLFWELTSISSFFLIQFNTDDASANSAALTGLLITVMGSLVMLIGFILLGDASNTLSISQIMTRPVLPDNALLIFSFILIGVVTKSAQFPFYFWLPGAMKAPTPVSAFLHSATMVNAGIYLLARCHPLFSQLSMWYPLLAFFGLSTMLVSSILSLFQSDLKALLAYTTIFALGAMVYLLGSTQYSAIEAFTILLLFHGIYKAAAFMLVGNLDKRFGTRDLLVLKGVLHGRGPHQLLMIIVFGAMAGLPPFFGFSVKEMIYEAKLAKESISIPIMGISIISSMFIAASSMHAVWILMKPKIGIAAKKSLGGAYYVGVAVLAAVIIVLSTQEPFLKDVVQSGIDAISPDSRMQFMTPNTFASYSLSLVTVLGGLCLSFLFLFTDIISSHWRQNMNPRSLFAGIFKMTLSTGNWLTEWTQGLSRQRHLLIMLTALSACMWFTFLLLLEGPLPHFTAPSHKEIFLFSILPLTSCTLLLTRNKLTNIVSLSVIGLAVACFFMLQGALDVAITQLLIEILTIVIILIALAPLKPQRQASRKVTPWFHYLIAFSFGLAVALCLLLFKATPLNGFLQAYYEKHSYLSAYGKNIVNVVLVDFRAFDTLGEVMVVFGTAMGIGLLCKRKKSCPSS